MVSPHCKKTIFWVLLVGVSAFAFVFGLMFRYNREVIALISQNQNSNIDGLTPKLATIIQLEKFILKYQEKEIIVGPDEFKSWVENYTRAYTGKSASRITAEKMNAYLNKISKEMDSEPINARLVIENDRVSEFAPPKAGHRLNIALSMPSIIYALTREDGKTGETKNTLAVAELAVDELRPQTTLDQVNSLGINTMLARGESNFSGSPKFRTHNITVGSKKFTGILVKPGEEFSFNRFLGEVDASNGYLPELVIKNGSLIAEYGGGLCQVSTTLFRAVALAGLPILERHPHSIPVKYYNPQGFDATIYPGVSDFRFKNDTQAYILIQSKIVGTKIYFEIYGTKDNRQVTLTGPRQFDIKPNGALKTELIRVVKYSNGTEKKDQFNSSYQAPGSFRVIKNPLE